MYIFKKKVQHKFISVFLLSQTKKQSSYWGDHNWELEDEDDSKARKAYEALLRSVCIIYINKVK